VNPVEHPLTAVVTTSISAMVRGKSQVHPNNVLVAEVLGNSAVAKISDLTTAEEARARSRHSVAVRRLHDVGLAGSGAAPVRIEATRREEMWYKSNKSGSPGPAEGANAE